MNMTKKDKVRRKSHAPAGQIPTQLQRAGISRISRPTGKPQMSMCNYLFENKLERNMKPQCLQEGQRWACSPYPQQPKLVEAGGPKRPWERGWGMQQLDDSIWFIFSRQTIVISAVLQLWGPARGRLCRRLRYTWRSPARLWSRSNWMQAEKMWNWGYPDRLVGVSIPQCTSSSRTGGSI